MTAQQPIAISSVKSEGRVFDNHIKTVATYTNPPNPSVVNDSHIPVNVNFNRYKHGYINPAWREEVAAGSEAATPYDTCAVNYCTASGSWRHYDSFKQGSLISDFLETRCFLDGEYPFNGGPWVNDYDGQLGVPSGSSASSQAATRFYKQVRKAIARFSAPVFAGEFEDTLRLGLNPFKTVSDLTLELHKSVKLLKRRLPNGRKLTKKLANLWLEYRLGVLPLLSDVQDYCTAYENSIHKIYRTYVCQGTGAWRKIISNEDLPFRYWYSRPCTGYQIVDLDHRCKMKGAVWAGLQPSISGARPRESTEAFGLSIREFFPTVWELIPYSFAIDYFADVGSLLQAASYQNTRLEWCITDHKIERTSTKVVSVPTYSGVVNGYHTLSGYGSQVGTWSKSRFIRSVGATEHVTSINLRIPSPLQVLNLSALLAQYIHL